MSRPAAEQQWWVTFKRHFYGLADRPAVLPVPQALAKPAPLLRAGTAAEAGVDPEVVAEGQVQNCL